MGSPSFVDFEIPGSVPAGLVAELVLQHRPTRIQDGLRHLGLCEFGRADISDDDEFVFASDLCRPLVEMMAARVSDLGVDRADATLVAGTLRDGERGFVLAIVAECRDNEAIAARGDGLEPEIDADMSGSGRQLLVDLAIKADIPASSGVLGKASRFDDTADVPRLPKMEAALSIDDAVAIRFDGLRLEWHPAKRTLWPEARAKSRTTFVLLSRECELAANLANAGGQNAEFRATAAGQVDEVERARPMNCTSRLPTPLGLALGCDAEVPHLVAGDGQPVEVTFRGRVFDAEFKGQDHRSIIAEFAEDAP